MESILIVEDNKDVNNMLKETLINAGYEVKSAYTGLDGMKEIKEHEYDLILLDIMLPYKSGDEILREVRGFSYVPIIVISAKDMVGTKIELLKMGADDYITKPFDLGEVAARVASTLRRNHKYKDDESLQTLKYKDIVLDENSKTVALQGKHIDLTSKEYMILKLLMENQDKVFSKANLYESVWNEEYLGDDNAVKTHMSNVRNKLKKVNPDEKYIETLWGMGYRLYKD